MSKIENAFTSLSNLFSRKPQARSEVPVEQVAKRPAAKDELTLTLAKQAGVKAPPKTDGLSDEEIGLLKDGFLPSNYSDLKACLQKDGKDAAIALARKDKEGPFSPMYGDPVAMLEAARRIKDNPEISRMVKDVRKGDLLVQTWNDDNNTVAQMTRGTFVHALICVSDQAPPEFVEAVGITGDPNDPDTNNVVRRGSIAENSYEGITTRLIRPTEGMPEADAAHAIDRAVRYAESQLGKPYDYSFTNRNGDEKLTDAFYCSELTYLAYASPSGANLPFPVSKSSDRDQMMVALESLITALDPKDKPALLDRTMKFINKAPKPDAKEMVKYLVDEVLSKCKATEEIATSPSARNQLKETIGKIMSGEALPRFEGAVAAYKAADSKGEFDGMAGFLKRQQAHGAIGMGFVMDSAELVGGSGVNYFEAAKTSKDLLVALLPHAETFSAFLYGPKDGRTEAVGKVLDGLDWVKDKVDDIPLIGDLLDGMPERSRPAIRSDFVSPTDLAYAPFSHHDYNVKPGNPLDRSTEAAA